MRKRGERREIKKGREMKEEKKGDKKERNMKGDECGKVAKGEERMRKRGERSREEGGHVTGAQENTQNNRKQASHQLQ